LSSRRVISTMASGKMANGMDVGSANGDIYDGEWQDGKRNGRGKVVFAKGDIYFADIAVASQDELLHTVAQSSCYILCISNRLNHCTVG